MIDSHCHLEMFKEELSDVVRRAYDSGVSTIVTVASDVESLDEVVKIAEQYPMVYATVGIHPHDAKDFNDKVLKKNI